MGNANADPAKTKRKSARLSCSAVICWLLTVLIKAATAAIFLLLWALLQLIFTRYYVPAFGFLESASGIPAVLFAVGTLILVLVYLFLIWVQPGRAKFRTSARNAGDGREPALIWSPDRPLTDPRHDALAYAEPARNLAESICSIVPEEGIVLAVCGPWGVGKTTFINFVEHFIGDGSRSR